MESHITWYQKKIGKYDNQPWEKAIEEWILYGLSHIPFNPAKPKKDLIDLDLVRGSSFTKAKPKHGFLTVTRLSVLRTLFLPLYAQWWMEQTSRKIFAILFLVYLMLICNFIIYFTALEHLETPNANEVPCSEILVPVLMLWILSYVHSQIVATSPLSVDSSKNKTKGRKLYSRRTHKKSQKRKCSVGYEREAGGTKNWNRTRSTRNFIEKNVVFQQTDDIIPNDNRPNIFIPFADDGFDSFNGSASSPSVNGEFIPPQINENNAEDNLRDPWPAAPENINDEVDRLRVPNEDDGFESFTGNGSSPSECGEMELPSTSAEKPSEVDKESAKDSVKEEDITDNEDKDDDDDIDSPRSSKCSMKFGKKYSLPPLNLEKKRLLCDSDSEECNFGKERKHFGKKREESICPSDEEGECETISSRETGSSHIKGTDATIMGFTTNSDDCSYNSNITESDTQSDVDAPPNFILSPYCGPSHRVSCTIWDHNDVKKADLSMIEISSVIIGRVETMPESLDCFYIGIFLTTILSILPIICRFCYNAIDSRNEEEMHVSILQITRLVIGKFSDSFSDVLDALLGTNFWERIILVTAALQRWILGCFLFFLLAVAERTFKQRFLYAKLFSHLTSSRRARKSDLPHFRLNKVRNIKTWLSVRSYLRKRGPQRSVEVIVSAAFIVTLLLLSFMCMELLKETFVLNSQYNLEILIWSISLGIMILRFMTLGVKINKKYRNLSVLITEQINLYLQIEQKPNKKEELMVANSVLKLAADLLKELESEFKILGLSANPVFYNVTKVVILSALSGVLSEILGFKLKLHKIKIK